MKHNFPASSLKALRLMAGFSLAANLAMADSFTIAGFTFDDANSVTTAAVVEGTRDLQIHSAPLFAGKGDLSPVGSRGAPDPYLTFQREKTIGRLLGGISKRRSASNPSLFVSFPGKNNGSPRSNVDRCTIELTWGGYGLRNTPGPDFVIYEVGKFEGVSISVKKAGADTFTPPWYQFASVYDLARNATSIPLDLSSLGLAEGDMITAIRLRNLFNSEARAGADKVDYPSGQGDVLYPGESGYSSSYILAARTIGSDVGLHKVDGVASPTLRNADEGGGREFSTDSLDTDLVFVVGLHGIEKVTEKLDKLAVQ